MVSAQQKAGIHRTDDPFLRRDDGELGERGGLSPFLQHPEGKRCNKHKSIEPQNHDGSLFLLSVAQASPGKLYIFAVKENCHKDTEKKKKLFLCVCVASFISGPFGPPPSTTTRVSAALVMKYSRHYTVSTL